MPEDPLIEEALGKLREASTETNAPAAAPAPAPFAVQTGGVSGINAPPELTRTLTEAQKTQYLQKQLGDAELAPGTEATGWQRFKAAFRTDPDEVVKYWQDIYGKDSVAKTTDGLYLKAGGKAFPVDLGAVNSKDVADWAGAFPSIAGSILAMVATKGKGPAAGGALETLKTIAKGSIGGRLADTAVQSGVRFADDFSVADGIREQLSMLPVDFALGYGAAGAGRLISKAITPFGGRIATVPQIQLDLDQSGKHWAAQGIDTVHTPGELTGNKMLLRSEAFVRQRPGGAGPFADILEKQRQTWLAIQNKIMGLPKDANPTATDVIPTLEDLTDELHNAVRRETDPLSQRIAGARTTLVDNATRRIKDSINSMGLTRQELDPGIVGDAIIAKTKALFSDFSDNAAQKYNIAYELPGGKTPVLAPESLPGAAKEYLKKDLEHVPVVKEVISFDQYGNPFTQNVRSRELAKEFIPEGIVNRLNRLAGAEGERWTLKDLVGLRSDVFNEILSQKAGAPNIKTHHLDKLHEMLNNAIVESTSKLPDNALKTAWENANSFYRDNIQKFKMPLPQKMLGEGAQSMSPHDLFAGLLSKTHRLEDVKELLGAGSAEYDLLKTAIRHQHFAGSLNVDNATVRAKDYFTMLAKMEATNPALFKEVYGPAGRDLLHQAQMLTVGQADSVAAGAIDAAIANPKTYPDLQKLMRAEKAKDAAYRNDILKMIGTRSEPGPGFNPGEFLQRFVLNGAPKEINEAMAILPQSTKDSVKRKTLQHIFEEVSRNPTPADPINFGPEVMSSPKLLAILKDSKRRESLNAVLGKETMTDLEMLAKELRPTEMREAAFSMSGGISAGFGIAQLIQLKLDRYVGSALNNWLAATMMTSPKVAAYFNNNVMTPARTHSLISTLVGTGLGLEALARDYGKQGAVEAANTLKKGIDAWYFDAMKEQKNAGEFQSQAMQFLQEQLTNTPEQNRAAAELMRLRGLNANAPKLQPQRLR